MGNDQDAPKLSNPPSNRGAEGQGDNGSLCELLPEIDKNTIGSTIGNMVRQDRVHKAGRVEGTRGYYYRVNDGWEPGLARKRRMPAGAGRPPPSPSEQRQLSPGNMKVIRYREQKIKLLMRVQRGFGEQLTSTERDLLIGLLADLGHSAGRAA